MKKTKKNLKKNLVVSKNPSIHLNKNYGVEKWDCLNQMKEKLNQLKQVERYQMCFTNNLWWRYKMD